MKKQKNLLISLISAILAVVTFFVYYKESETVYIYIAVAFIFGTLYFGYKYIEQLRTEAKKKLKNNPEIIVKRITDESKENRSEKLSNRFEKIPIRYPDGKVRYEVAAKAKAPQGYCFYIDDSKTYHTHADCYVNWKPEFRKSLAVWNCIKIESAINYGLKKCKFCEQADEYEQETVYNIKTEPEYSDSEFSDRKKEKDGNNETISEN